MTNRSLANLIIRRTKENNSGRWEELLFSGRYTLMSCFLWIDTPEGGYFWVKVNKRLGINLTRFLLDNINDSNFISLEYII